MSVLTCKVDDDLKKDADVAFNDQLILERVKESEDPKNLSPVFSSMEEAKAWLDA